MKINQRVRELARLIMDADAPARLRAENERLRAALDQIARGPFKPFPDPGAHSWRAFGTAAHNCVMQWRNLARLALAPPPNPPDAQP